MKVKIKFIDDASSSHDKMFQVSMIDPYSTWDKRHIVGSAFTLEEAIKQFDRNFKKAQEDYEVMK